MAVSLDVLVDMPLEEQIPSPSMFHHHSKLHGQLHVARVMVHACLLLRLCRKEDERPKLWAAVYLHDIARQHDGVCHEHGARAVRTLQVSDELQRHLATAGVRPDDYPSISTAVVHHCKPQELSANHVDYPLAALLKDADGLDRVRLGDLDPHFLRYTNSKNLILFAQSLYEETNELETGDSCFPKVWGIAKELWNSGYANALPSRSYSASPENGPVFGGSTTSVCSVVKGAGQSR